MLALESLHNSHVKLLWNVIMKIERTRFYRMYGEIGNELNANYWHFYKDWYMLAV